MKPDLVFALDNAAWPVLILDGSGTICRANPAAVKLFGPALEAHSARLGAIWAPENTASADQFLPSWERNPSPTARLKFRGKGGSTFASGVSLCSLLRDEQRFFVMQLLPEAGSTTHLVKPAGDTAHVQKQKLDFALQLARTVALDFNNALTSILGHASLTLAELKPDDPHRASLLEVEKSVRRGAEIAEDLANFSRQGKEPRSQPAANLNLLLQRTVDAFRNQLKDTSVDWQFALEARLFAARMDEAQMQHAFARLLDNAVESFSGSGRITIRTRNVELSERSQDRTVQLPAGAYICAEITDNGCGIPPEVLPRIFEPLFTTKQGDHRGVGLPWVYGVATNHGGGVAVSSQHGEGTSVRLYLPADTRVVNDNRNHQADLRGDNTILFVEHDDLVLAMAERVLRAYGYHPLTANSGQKALEALASGKPPVDLVLADCALPPIQGQELKNLLHAARPTVPIIITSGFGCPQGDESLCLQKPYTAQDLLLVVKRALNP